MAEDCVCTEQRGNKRMKDIAHWDSTESIYFVVYNKTLGIFNDKYDQCLTFY